MGSAHAREFGLWKVWELRRYVTALRALGIRRILIVGGTAAVSSDVEATLDRLGYHTDRLAGTDRWGTNVVVAEHAVDEHGFGGPVAYLSSGSAFADALAAGPAAGRVRAPLLLTASDSLPAPVQGFLTGFGAALEELVVVGGSAAIDPRAVAAASARRPDRPPVPALAPPVAANRTNRL